MKSFSFVLLLVVVASVPAGCSKKTTAPKAKAARTVRTSTSSYTSRLDRNDQAIEDDERAIEQHANDAKRTIDAIAHEAEDALKKARENAKSRAQRHAQELSEFAAEMAEEAKDRAEDIPEVVDGAIQRQADRRQGSRPKRPVSDEDESDE